MLMMRCCEALDELGGEDLHVAREHDEIDRVLLEQRDLRGLLRGLGLGRDREHAIGHAELRRDRRELLVVADDQRDLAGELARAVAQQQVVEAVVGARDEDRDALAARGVASRQVMRRRAATSAIAASRLVRSVRSSEVSKRMRWKKIPATASVCWSASRMLAPCP